MDFFMKQKRTSNSFQKFRIKVKKSKTFSGLCPFLGLSTQWYHSQANLIWPDGIFQECSLDNFNEIRKMQSFYSERFQEKG
jgi:hypothetical protein